jgi:hypothetical protein
MTETNILLVENYLTGNFIKEKFNYNTIRNIKNPCGCKIVRKLPKNNQNNQKGAGICLIDEKTNNILLIRGRSYWISNSRQNIHKTNGKWGFPKGKRLSNESEWDNALREFNEEIVSPKFRKSCEKELNLLKSNKPYFVIKTKHDCDYFIIKCDKNFFDSYLYSDKDLEYLAKNTNSEIVEKKWIPISIVFHKQFYTALNLNSGAKHVIKELVNFIDA